MKNPVSNITTLGNQASVRALSAQRRRRLRATRPESMRQLHIVADTAIPDPQAPETGARALLFEWGALGTRWGAVLGLGFALILVPVALATIGSLMIAYPDSRALQVALAVGSAVAGVLGIASPGLRKAAMVLLCVAPLALGGCASLQAGAARVGSRTLDCSIGVLASGATEALPAVMDALGGSSGDWQSQLDAIGVRAGGDILICAVRAAMAELSSRPAAGSSAWQAAYLTGASRSVELRYSRARAWQRANGVE